MRGRAVRRPPEPVAVDLMTSPDRPRFAAWRRGIVRGTRSRMDPISIDGARLWTSLMELAKIGAYQDETCALVGVNRLALTDADGAGRSLVKRWFEEAG